MTAWRTCAKALGRKKSANLRPCGQISKARGRSHTRWGLGLKAGLDLAKSHKAHHFDLCLGAMESILKQDWVTWSGLCFEMITLTVVWGRKKLEWAWVDLGRQRNQKVCGPGERWGSQSLVTISSNSTMCLSNWAHWGEHRGRGDTTLSIIKMKRGSQNRHIKWLISSRFIHQSFSFPLSLQTQYTQNKKVSSRN